jgi:hypothetical protein
MWRRPGRCDVSQQAAQPGPGLLDNGFRLDRGARRRVLFGPGDRGRRRRGDDLSLGVARHAAERKAEQLTPSPAPGGVVRAGQGQHDPGRAVAGQPPDAVSRPGPRAVEDVSHDRDDPGADGDVAEPVERLGTKSSAIAPPEDGMLKKTKSTRAAPVTNRLIPTAASRDSTVAAPARMPRRVRRLPLADA